MPDMHLPADIVHTYEFKQLAEELRSPGNAAMALLSLFAELAVIARSNNAPGRIEKEVKIALEWRDSRETHVVTTSVFLAKPFPLLVEQADGSFHCDMFARSNAHLAGNFMSQAKKGGLLGGMERRKAAIARDAVQQATLLPATLFTAADGATLSPEETERVMVLVKTIDGILRLKSRANHEFTPGLIAAAAAVVTKFEPLAVKRFLSWLSLHRDHPVVERDTAKLLGKFELILPMTA